MTPLAFDGLLLGLPTLTLSLGSLALSFQYRRSTSSGHKPLLCSVGKPKAAMPRGADITNAPQLEDPDVAAAGPLGPLRYVEIDLLSVASDPCARRQSQLPLFRVIGILAGTRTLGATHPAANARARR